MIKKKIKPMVRLTEKQIQDKLDFIDNYLAASNASTASMVDANANVEIKTVATLGAELNKDINIQLNRRTLYNKITELFGLEVADRYILYLEDHLIYKHDESAQTPGTPYCVAINMYPLLEHGIIPLGGSSSAPKHLDSYCGIFINLIYDVSAEFAGAVAAVEALLYFHHFAVKDYGEKYLEEHPEYIKSKFKQIIYSINESCSSRGGQCPFTNFSLFDRYFFESMFGNFYFPDGTHYDYDSFNKLQKFFMEWLLVERTRSVLTFPVLTEASLNDGDEPKDKEWADFCADIRSRGLSFFSFNDDTASALSSCCRLKNELDQQLTEFSYTLGAGGVSTGSTSVITINLNRLFQKGHILEELISDVHMFQVAHRRIVEEYVAAGVLPVYDAGFITLDKQFCTIGLNGLNEAAEFLGYEVSNNTEYLEFCANLLGTFKRLNLEAKKKYGIKFNTELVPAENLGVKNAQWDKKEGLVTTRDCYNSYIYLPESDTTSIPDKFKMHGGIIADSIDGGSALHLNIAGLPDKEFFLWLRKLAALYHTTYWTTNVKGTVCNHCGYIDPNTVDKCVKCESTDLDYTTRIIGFCKKISNFSEARQVEEAKRFYH